MRLIKNRSWQSIREHYESLGKHGWEILPMIDLVNYLISSKYSDRLFAFTSLDILIISIYEEIDKFSEAFHIKYDTSSRFFLLSYYGGHSHAKQPEWERQYASDIIIDKFDKFMQMIKW